MRGLFPTEPGGNNHDAEAWLRQLFPNAKVSVQKEMAAANASQPHAGYVPEVGNAAHDARMVNGDYESHGRGRPQLGGPQIGGPGAGGPGRYPYYRDAEAPGKGGGKDSYPSPYDYGDQLYRDVSRMMQRPPDGGRGRYGEAGPSRYDEYARQAAMMAQFSAAAKKPDPRVADVEAGYGMRNPAGYGYGSTQPQDPYMRDTMNSRIPHLSAGYESRGYPPQMDWNARGDWHDDYDQYASNGKGHPHQRHGKGGGKMT
jgi:hypothetical protein